MRAGRLISGVVSGTLSNHYVIGHYVISHYVIRLFLKEKSEFSSKILITAGVTYASLYIFERLRSVF